MRNFGRKLRQVGIGLSPFFLFPLLGNLLGDAISEFFIEWLREKGVYENPSERMASVMGGIWSLITHPITVWVSGVLIGIVIGLWIDVLLRRQESRPDERQERIRRWRQMIAETGRKVGEGQDIRYALLGSPDFLDLDRYLHPYISNFVRTGIHGAKRTYMATPHDEGLMPYADRVLLHLNKEVQRIEKEWNEAGGDNPPPPPTV